MGLLNAWRVKRLKHEGVVVLVILLCSIVTLWFGIGYYRAEYDGSLGSLRVVNQGVGFLLVGAIYLLFKRHYSSMKVVGADPPSPYLPVISSIVVSFGMLFLIAMANEWALHR